MESLDSLYCEFVSALVRESDWNKSIFMGFAHYESGEDAYLDKKQMLHIQGSTAENWWLCHLRNS